MGKKHKLLVEAAKVRNAAVGYVEKHKDALKEKAKGQMGNQILIEIPKLVRDDIKKGKVKDVEEYVKKSLHSLRPGTQAGNMCRNSGVTLEEVEALIGVSFRKAKERNT